ncbi:MAG: hypothetical protein JXA60_00620 [Candidatus Coatesbacteria bacterium]|nr:hypothetical protein [Candidatus Coatesbacteria bacterium]
MAIVKMKKLQIIGLSSDKKRILETLQTKGLVHIIPLRQAESQEFFNLSKTMKEHLMIKKWVSSLFAKRKVERKTDTKDPYGELMKLHIEHEKLHHNVIHIKTIFRRYLPFSYFDIDQIRKLEKRNINVQLVSIPKRKWEDLKDKPEYFFVINEIAETLYIAIFTKNGDIISIPKSQEYPLPEKSLKDIEDELARTEKRIIEIEEIAASYLEYFQDNKDLDNNLINAISFEEAKETSLDKEILFAIEAWCPLKEVETVRNALSGFKLVFMEKEAEEDEQVPCLIKNPKWIQSIYDFVKVYSLPNYWESDSSTIVLVFFIIFFGMIMSDAGYGLTLLLIMLFLRKLLSRSDFGKRFFRLSILLSLSTITYGILSSTFFGTTIYEYGGDFFRQIAPFAIDIKDMASMERVMYLSIFLGVVHLTFAYIVSLRIKSILEKLTTIGWIIVLWSGFAFWWGIWPSPETKWAAVYGKYGLIMGFSMVFLFTSSSKNILIRILEGLYGMLGITQLFADVLSYLRLFALGLAGACLSSTFNNMGMELSRNIPYAGFILAILLFIAGHIINLGLSIMGGFLHGLRLNFIESYRYFFNGDGLDYKPFKYVK